MPRHNPAATGGTVVLDAPPAAPAASSTPASPNPAPKASAPAQGLRKVSFGKIAKKDETTKTAYPVFPDEQGNASEIAARSALITSSVSSQPRQLSPCFSFAWLMHLLAISSEFTLAAS
jgi:hypothetical protein